MTKERTYEGSTAVERYGDLMTGRGPVPARDRSGENKECKMMNEKPVEET